MPDALNTFLSLATAMPLTGVPACVSDPTSRLEARVRSLAGTISVREQAMFRSSRTYGGDEFLINNDLCSAPHR